MMEQFNLKEHQDPSLPLVCKTVSNPAVSLSPSSLLKRVWCMKSSGAGRRMAPSHLVLTRVVYSPAHLSTPPHPSLCSSSSFSLLFLLLPLLLLRLPSSIYGFQDKGLTPEPGPPPPLHISSLFFTFLKPLLMQVILLYFLIAQISLFSP